MLLRSTKIQTIRVVSTLLNIRKLNFSEGLLIIAPHPDDEVLGCGGLIQQALAHGSRVDVVILTNGEASHDGCCNKADIAENRTRLTYRAAQTIGLQKENIHKLDFKDGGVSLDDKENIDRLYELLATIQPKQIYIPHQNEGWNDHIVVKGLIDSFLEQNHKVEMYEYLVWSWYYVRGWFDWRQCKVLNMTRQETDIKKQAIKEYTTDIAPCGKPWSGTLPSILTKACGWNRELYFKVR